MTAWRNDPARADEVKSILANADHCLAEPVIFPVAEGQWYFFYLCPLDGTQLTAESPTRHRCGKCGAAYEDERTCAAYRGIQWGEVDQAISKLALAYALSGDERYAAEARRLFLKVAETYPKLVRHDRWGDWGTNAPAGGRRYAQRLDESTSGIQLAKAYDLIANAPCMTDADRQMIEAQFFRQLATDLQTDATRAMWEVENPKDGDQRTRGTASLQKEEWRVGLHPDRSSPHRSNHQSWQDACLATIGLALGDESLMEQAIYGPTGLQWQLDNSVTDEGLWYELCMNYQFYAMSALIETVQAADRVGWSFRDKKRLRSLWEGPIRFSYPDGSFPVINDSDVDRLQNHTGLYQWAADYFGDPALASMSDPVPETRARMGATVSTNMVDVGLIYLRNGDPSNPVCVVLDYGPNGGQHGHPDKLNITVYAHGQEIIADTGRIGYNYREYHAWARTTAANNTVVIDGQDQQPAEGRLVSFVGTSNGGTVTAVCDTAYPGYVITRTLTLVGARLTDELSVVGEQTATIDLFTHVRGLEIKHARISDADSESRPTGRDPGAVGRVSHPASLPDHDAPTGLARYPELKNVCPGRDGFHAVLLAGCSGRITCDDDASYFTGTAVGTRLDDSVPFLLRRIEGTQALFKTTYTFSPPRICFVCTGNYYRSRFAEEYFNQKASERGLACRAESRGTSVDVPVPWPTGMSPVAVEQLAKHGITPTGTNRWPVALSGSDASTFDIFVALNRNEHAEAMQRAGIASNSIVFWTIEDVANAPADQEIPRLVTELDAFIDTLAGF